MQYSEKDFGVKHWTCVVTDTPADVDMISGDVLSKNEKGITISVENVVGPNDDTFFPYEDIYEKIA